MKATRRARRAHLLRRKRRASFRRADVGPSVDATACAAAAIVVAELHGSTMPNEAHRLHLGPAMPSILVVEDDAAIRESMCELLRRAGYEITSAADGRDAIDQLHARTTPFSVLLLDWILPEIGGAEVVARVREMPLHATTPIVVLSAHDRILCSADLTAVIAKPVRGRTLIEVIDRVANMPRRARTVTAPVRAVADVVTQPTSRNTAPTVVLRPPRG